MASSTVKNIRTKITADASQFKKEFQSASKAMGRSAAKMRSIGKGMTLGVTAPILAIGASMLKSAGDAQIIESKFKTVFGASSASARKWRKDVAKASGVSAFALRESLAASQDLLTGFGVTETEAAGLSQNFNQLAVDLAAFNNVSAEQASAAFNSAIVGETEALKTLGVVINQDAINRELQRQGIEGGTKAATAAQKAQAILALALGQTANAQGAAARQTNTFNGKLKAAKARFTDIATEIGAKLLPMGVRLLDWVSEGLDKFEGLSDSTINMGLAVAGVAAAMGPLLLVGGGVLGMVTKLAAPLNIVVGIFGTMVKAVRLLNLAAIRLIATALSPILLPLLAIGAAVAATIFAFQSLKKAFRQSGRDLLADIRGMVSNISGFVTGLATGVTDFFSGIFRGFVEKARTILDALARIPGVKKLLGDISDFGKAALNEFEQSAK